MISEISILVLTLISICLSIAFILSLAYLRTVDDKVIRWSSPLFLALIGMGSILIVCTNFTWFPNGVTDVSCHLRFWIINYGFILFYGPLWAKTLRIVVIFRHSKTLEIVNVSDKSLFLFLGVLFAIDTVKSFLFLLSPVKLILFSRYS